MNMKKCYRGITGPLIIVIFGFVAFAVFWAHMHPNFFAVAFGGGASVASADHIPADWKSFRSSSLGISVLYPPDYVANTAYTYTELGPRSGIVGVKFLIAPSRTFGTNLSYVGSGVSFEVLPTATACMGTEFVYQKVNPEETLSKRGVTYSVARSVGAGAGNYFEEIVYALVGSEPCTAVRYFIRSTTLENFEPGTVDAFDKKALIKEFDAIRASLVLERTTR